VRQIDIAGQLDGAYNKHDDGKMDIVEGMNVIQVMLLMLRPDLVVFENLGRFG